MTFINHFIGRQKELKQLNLLLKKNSASLVVVKGRRRIGKSRLIEEFGKDFKTLVFSGVPPTENTTLKGELHEFGWQLGKALGQPPFKDDDWNDLFLRLAHHTRKGRILILLDEISWMGSKDPHFLGKLKNVWDLELKKNPQLILVLCGSVSSWIEKNILSSTGFLGRISLNLTLEDLPLADCNKFWQGKGGEITPYEKFKVLSVTGGIPKYLEEIHPHLSAEENIKNLCFERSGLLFNEFEQIFTNIFSSRSETYKKIVQCLADGIYDFEGICNKLNLEKSGVISEYLADLVESGFVRRDFTWHLQNGKRSKLSHYRISDNYLRFYLKYIAPNKEKIERDNYVGQSLTFLPGWEGIMGLQFENLVLNNRQSLLKRLNIKPDEVIYDNPFFQKKTLRQEGCQIDYMVQTRFDTLYICEIKFSKHPLKARIIKEMREKVETVKVPRHVSRRPVLIHVNGINDDVVESQYFSHMIDFSELLYEPYEP
ncbi:MAG: Archaeal ATPase family protein [Alphaproteobacteria bacterium]|jgi:AAA+ ATPase superfamily predicted ATPase|nr:Archaeal ATPase family protein [Alphaproteobacteria bacterium]